MSSLAIAELLQLGEDGEPQGISIVPSKDISKIRDSGEASITMRLGRWFLSMKQSNETHLDITPDEKTLRTQHRIVKKHFVPFGQTFVIHPGRFVLASTLEWITLPLSISGYVAGKSTWGRRGVVIETAAGVHPAFSGCLTLEIANVGEVPVSLRPGMEICQLFLHKVQGELTPSRTSLAGKRRPALGSPKTDPVLTALTKPGAAGRSQ